VNIIMNDNNNYYDPTAPCCAWCYTISENLKKCANCPRRYCGKECQKKDWSSKVGGGGGHHKFWCCKSGEKDTDYEIRSAGDAKGLGLFAKRDFQRGEKILVERSIMTRNEDGSISKDAALVTESRNTLNAFMSLAPSDSDDWWVKFETNSVALAGNEEGDKGSGVFLHFSRANHDCVGNVSHYFEPKMKLRLLVVDNFIVAGSEITFSYASNCTHAERRMMMMSRGFDCRCQACQLPEVSDKLDRIIELDKKIMNLGSVGKTEHAVRAGAALIKLYDEMKAPDIRYSRTHYDMFSMNITRKKTLQVGLAHLRKAHEHALRFYGWEENEVVREYSPLLSNPTSHPNYLLFG
jgi:hypothetical protein